MAGFEVITEALLAAEHSSESENGSQAEQHLLVRFQGARQLNSAWPTVYRSDWEIPK